MHNHQHLADYNTVHTPEPICTPSEGSGTSSPNTDMACLISAPIEIPDGHTPLQSAENQQGARNAAPSLCEKKASVAFSQLPVELALGILKYCFPDRPSPSRSLEDMMNIYTVRLVSRSWKELIEETPWFWFHLSIIYPAQVIQDSLRRSKDHPLRIHVSQAPGETTEVYEDFLRLVQTQSHRWLSLELVMIDDLLPEELAMSILSSPAPGLQSLTAVFPAGQFTQNPVVDLMSGTAHQLKGLHLCGVPIACDSESFRGLEDLRHADSQGLSAPEAVELLTRNSSLRFLVLSGDPAEMQNNAGPISPRGSIRSVATAPSLKLLHLKCLPIHTLTHILTSVLMPTCWSLHLDIVPESFSDFMEIKEALAQFLPKIRQTLRSCDETTIIVDCNGLYQWMAQSSSSSKEVFDFSFAVCGPPMGDFLEWIGRISQGCRQVFRVEMKAMDLGAWHILGCCEEVIELVPMFEDRQGELPTFIESLSDVVRGSDGQLTWCFPGLRKLRLEFAEGDLLDIFSMLNKRYVPVPIPGDPLVGTPSTTLDIPPKLQIWMGEATNSAIIRALRRHWAVESLVATREIE
ncbi:hypothetical protein M407DRAFT_222843 [Tulasnella calospora MUT 4182]|uniref:F-box domain-containing protein n=1 Tax=Tulasnella calospora MUT 4182 TaxID=1051891 RepID=A0A0C3L9S9_9AGAM|nr:hypothetical protein M407DRAFT_222843 [Tulasnella calospora MUT 4182]